MIHEIDIVEEINDGNLFLKKISKEDISFFFHSLKDKEITSYLSLGPLRSFEHSKRLVKNYLKSWDKYLQFNYIIELKEKSRFEKIGSISLWNISWLHKRSGLGIWILPNFWNKGYGTKAIGLVERIAFNHLKLNRLEAHVAIENTRSLKLFNKCNFKEEGLLSEYLNINGLFRDAVIYSKLNLK